MQKQQSVSITPIGSWLLLLFLLAPMVAVVAAERGREEPAALDSAQML